MLQASTLSFLAQLKKNNNRDWFLAHKKNYEVAKEDFLTFIQQVIDAFSKHDATIEGIQAKDCMFRINRDIRFSKDKSPYKTNFGASINKGGRKSMQGGYYFHCEPGSAFIGGGVYMPTADALQKIRQEIDYCFDEWKAILKAPTFVKEYGGLAKDKEYLLVRPPKGYDADNPAIEYLKHTSWIAVKQINGDALTDKNLLKNTVKTYAALTPMVDFLNRAF